MTSDVTPLKADRVTLDGPLVLLPVRHHSPACAWQTQRLIEAYRPTVVLIEGPQDANERMAELLDEKTKPPVAIYAFVHPSAERQGVGGRQGSASWYPFCDYSPEYVALKSGAALGAEVAFIDLPSWSMARFRAEGNEQSSKATNSYADHQLRHHAFVDELCRKTGCRDFDDLWDTLFEANGFDSPASTFWDSAATFCRIAREHSDPAMFAKDGTTARESFMAARIAERLADDPLAFGRPAAARRVLVVTGGFHRAGILELLQNSPGTLHSAPLDRPPKEADCGCYLTAYGYQQLDRWSGYQSGMPAPAFYQSLWKAASSNSLAERSCDRFFGDLCRHLRKRGEEVSTANLIDALRMLRGLASHRGHRRPTREDVRDAVRATWVKGAVDQAHGRVIELTDRFLAGVRVGTVTPAAGTPPLVRDFHDECRRHKLEARSPTIKGSNRPASKQLALDIYGRPAHRQRSAFLHRLVELSVPYAQLKAGPAFVTGEDLHRVREVWETRWTPSVEAVLIAQSLYGATIEEAASNHLLERFQQAQHVIRADEATRLLTAALVMALPALADELLVAVESALIGEGEFVASAGAFADLAGLLAYRAILGASRHEAIIDLAVRGYQRAVSLLDTLPGLSADRVEPALAALARLRHAALAQVLPQLDADLFFEALAALRQRLGRFPLLEGAVVGVLRQGGRLDEGAIRQALDASIANTVSGPDAPLGDFLRGLFTMTRHAVVESDELLTMIHDCVASLPEERFRGALPSLRLAFTSFPPREVHRLARAIDRLAGGKEPAPALAASPQDTQWASETDRVVAELLDKYGV